MGEGRASAVLCVTQISGAAQYVVNWVPPRNPHNPSKTRVWKPPDKQEEPGRCKTAAAALREDVSLFLFPSLCPKSGDLVAARRTHPDITLLTPH